jgi:hypothetical protein
MNWKQHDTQYAILKKILQTLDQDTLTIAGTKDGGSLDVNVQDQTTPHVLAPFMIEAGHTHLSVAPVPNTYTLSVDDATGIVAGQTLTVLSGDHSSYYGVVSVLGNDITVDQPVDDIQRVGDTVYFGSTELAVDGSSIVKTATIRVPLGVKFDLVSWTLVMETTGTPEYSQFGTGAALTNGLLFRYYSAVTGYKNVTVVRKNGDLGRLGFDYKSDPGISFASGEGGIFANLNTRTVTGTVHRVGHENELQRPLLVVRDDITTRANSLNITLLGHMVKD